VERHRFDVAVIGGGIAGASAAAQIAEHRRVVLIEAEDVAGYHSTGRSAAVWLINYGTPDAQILTRESGGFLRAPPAGFCEGALMKRRGAMYVVRPGQEEAAREMLASGIGLREMDVAELLRVVPAVRREAAVGAVIEEDAGDLDVALLHQSFLALLRRRGGVVALGRRVADIAKGAGGFEVSAGGEVFEADVVVNAAGAWGDAVGRMAGARPLGLRPKRRTACIIDPAPYQVETWPMVHDMGDGWYCRPEARTKLMVSPADETDTEPCDAQPEEIDVAIGIDNMQQVLDIAVRRVERSWAGLRTFTPDRGLAIGFDPVVDGLLWCVGQGGYGIQTSPAAGRLVAGLVAGRVPEALRGVARMVDPGRFSGQ
jgi:D-arginine dehydrogenase